MIDQTLRSAATDIAEVCFIRTANVNALRRCYGNEAALAREGELRVKLHWLAHTMRAIHSMSAAASSRGLCAAFMEMSSIV